MSIKSELNSFYWRIESASELKPVSRDSAEGKAAVESETNFLKRLLKAIDRLQQKEELQGFGFSLEPEKEGGLVVVMADRGGEVIARLDPEYCIQMAKQSSVEGLLVETRC
ncbi:hypothetical protein ACH42_14990 [Endozoicomonas sp. (ex Bugula neritina AB1)]|nr:hypothetical protein ACH42_14990 [Endozoicomonas sp. (ex Bugula neritina AB1)]